MASFTKAQYIVGIAEGGYQDDPRDAGNYYKGNLIGTNYGISAPVLAGFLGRTPSKEDMINLSRNTAESILKSLYWLKNHLDKLKNQSVATLIYDGVVNQGTHAMRIILEKSLKTLGRPLVYYQTLTQGGIRVLNGLNQKKLFYTIKDFRRQSYLSKSNKTFERGWLKRLDKIRYYPTYSLSRIWPYAAMIFLGAGLILMTAI